MALTNKGEGSGKYSGTRFYKITKPVTEERLKELLAYKVQTDFYSADAQESPFEKLFGLEAIRTISSAEQKVGCCVFANNRFCLKSALILLGLSNQEAQIKHRECKQRARLYWLESIFLLIDKEETDDNLKKELYFCLLLLTLKLHTQKIYRRRENKHDNVVLEAIKAKVLSLQKGGDNHPYLKKILEFMENKITYHGLNKDHEEVITQSINAYGTYYQKKYK